MDKNQNCDEWIGANFNGIKYISRVLINTRFTKLGATFFFNNKIKVSDHLSNENDIFAFLINNFFSTSDCCAVFCKSCI